MIYRLIKTSYRIINYPFVKQVMFCLIENKLKYYLLVDIIERLNNVYNK